MKEGGTREGGHGEEVRGEGQPGLRLQKGVLILLLTQAIVTFSRFVIGSGNMLNVS